METRRIPPILNRKSFLEKLSLYFCVPEKKEPTFIVSTPILQSIPNNRKTSYSNFIPPFDDAYFKYFSFILSVSFYDISTDSLLIVRSSSDISLYYYFLWKLSFNENLKTFNLHYFQVP